MNTLIERRYAFTSEGKRALHEALIMACDMLSTSHICLCDALDDAARAVATKYPINEEERLAFADAVVHQVQLFRPPGHEGESGYFWDDPDILDVNDVEELREALETHAQRCLALAFLFSMSEAGDL